MPGKRHILLNGLSAGSGGGYTVARELLRHLAAARPDWKFTIVLTQGKPLHEGMRGETLPTNATVLWAPHATGTALNRARYERTDLTDWIGSNGVSAVVQLNGMIIPGLRIPTLSHMQDPWPYRPEAWTGIRDRAVAMLKRRRHRRAMQEAACVGWTSHYLETLISEWQQIKPKCSEVFYNGIPDAWRDRGTSAPEWATRPMELLSVSNVDVYKRQYLVIDALPALIKKPGLESLIYRIVGHCSQEYRQTLVQRATRLGVADRVILEGRVSDDRVQELFAQAKCFVLMSVCESFGIPAIEAMSFGTPVIVSDCCAMPEVCGSAAILSKTDNMTALIQNLSELLQSKEVAERLRTQGFDRIRRFGWSESAALMANRLSDMVC